MRKLILLFLITLSLSSYSQSNTKINYSDGELYMVKQDVNTYEVIS